MHEYEFDGHAQRVQMLATLVADTAVRNSHVRRPYLNSEDGCPGRRLDDKMRAVDVTQDDRARDIFATVSSAAWSRG